MKKTNDNKKRYTLSFPDSKKDRVYLISAGLILLMIAGWLFWKNPAQIDTPSDAASYCRREIFETKSYIVCHASPAHDDIRLFLYNEQGDAYRRFAHLNAALAKGQERLAFAMNAGMYHADYRAVGLYIENGRQQHAISTKDGPGNFHMKPNGIFYLEDGQAGILETQSYLERFQQSGNRFSPRFATQSGPMLVMDNRIHPRFIPNSPFLEYRNGVGVTPGGEVWFVISEKKVNFDEMARFFRDALGAPNALFLDGSISSLYAPEMGRADWWYPMGPIVGVVIKTTDATAITPP